jgi:hypothetical protein
MELTKNMNHFREDSGHVLTTEPRACRIRSRRATHSTAKFGHFLCVKNVTDFDTS